MRSADENKELRRGLLSEENEAKILESIGRAIKGGDASQVLHGLRHCFMLGITPPRWLTNTFCKRVDHAADFYESWDRVFGQPHKKGRKKAGRELEKYAVPIFLKIRALRASGMRGDEVYRKAAADLKIYRDWQTIRDAYYSRSEWHGFQEWAIECIEAMERAQIRTPDGEVTVSEDEYKRWLTDWFEAHPAPPSPLSSSEKRPKIKRKRK
jgi:hypothetical protein